MPTGTSAGIAVCCFTGWRSEVDAEAADHTVDIALQIAQHEAMTVEILDTDIGKRHWVPDQVDLAGDQFLVEAAIAGAGEFCRAGADKPEPAAEVVDVVVQDAGADVRPQ